MGIAINEAITLPENFHDSKPPRSSNANETVETGQRILSQSAEASDDGLTFVSPVLLLFQHTDSIARITKERKRRICRISLDPE